MHKFLLFETCFQKNSSQEQNRHLWPKKGGGAVPLLQAGQINLIEAAPFALLCLVGLYVAGRFFWSVQEEKALSRGEMLPAIADASQHDSQPPALTRR